MYMGDLGSVGQDTNWDGWRSHSGKGRDDA